jgi:hypothetical protein
MESLYIEATATTPKIDFNIQSGVFSIEGKAIDNDAENFFKPVLAWLSEYVETPHQKTEVVVKLDYFNISSSKRILFMFYKLNELHDRGNDVAVKWHYQEDEDDMFEVGQDFAFMVKIPFEFCEYSLFDRALA